MSEVFKPVLVEFRAPGGKPNGEVPGTRKGGKKHPGREGGARTPRT